MALPTTKDIIDAEDIVSESIERNETHLRNRRAVATEAGVTLDGRHYVLGDAVNAADIMDPVSEGVTTHPASQRSASDPRSLTASYDHFTALLRQRVVEWDREKTKSGDIRTAIEHIPSFWRLLGYLNREMGKLMDLNDALLRREEVSVNMAAMAKVTTDIAFWAMLMYTRRRLDISRKVQHTLERSARGGS